jgi:hypothetical protein
MDVGYPRGSREQHTIFPPPRQRIALIVACLGYTRRMEGDAR